MRILVVGAGMYVTGRGGGGTGTILASLCEASRILPIDQVTVVARKLEDAEIVSNVVGDLNRRLGTCLRVDFLTVSSDIEEAATQAVLASRADAAIICVPDHLHYPYASALLDRGLHVMLVKPFTTTLEEGRDLVRRQKAMQRIGVVEFHKRWDEQNLLARRLLGEGELGSVLYSVIQYSQRIDIPRDVFRAWSDKTNIFQYLGVHYVDLFHFLTGARPIRVSALGTRGALAGQGINTPDSVHATVVWQPPGGGADIITQFAINWIDPSCTTALSDQRYTLVGTKGRLDLDQKDRGVTLASAGQGVRALNPYFADFLDSGDGRQSYSGYGPRSIIQYLRDVADVSNGSLDVRSLEGRRPTFSEALVSVAVTEMVGRSLENAGAWQEISHVVA